MVSAIEAEATPRSPYRLPGWLGADGAARRRGPLVERLLRVDGAWVIARAWQRGDGDVVLASCAVDPRLVESRGEVVAREAVEDDLKLANERLRFALGVDDDVSEFHAMFGHDRMLGAAIRRAPRTRVTRRPWAWEAFAWAVTEQLIEFKRAAAIQRRIVWRWGYSVGAGRSTLRDLPGPERVAALAPAELESADLSGKRAIALRRCAAEIAAGRADPALPESDERLLAVPEIGPWTIACLALFGRGDMDALPAGDLDHLKLVGYVERLGRLATIEEVEEFYESYRPYRGLAATVMLRARGGEFRGRPMAASAPAWRAEASPSRRSAAAGS